MNQPNENHAATLRQTTKAMFDRALLDVMDRLTSLQLLTVPGAYDVFCKGLAADVAEHVLREGWIEPPEPEEYTFTIITANHTHGGEFVAQSALDALDQYCACAQSGPLRTWAEYAIHNGYTWREGPEREVQILPLVDAEPKETTNEHES